MVGGWLRDRLGGNLRQLRHADRLDDHVHQDASGAGGWNQNDHPHSKNLVQKNENLVLNFKF